VNAGANYVEGLSYSCRKLERAEPKPTNLRIAKISERTNSDEQNASSTDALPSDESRLALRHVLFETDTLRYELVYSVEFVRVF
jgi:hypothetical protein